MNSYMTTILIKDDLAEKERVALIEGIKKQMGKISKEDLWGKKELAYPILHQNEAYYAHFEFESEPATISTLDKTLKLNEDIIRYLIVRTKAKNKAK